MASDKTLSEEAKEFKFKQYVQRVNDTLKKIMIERRDIMKKQSGFLTVD